MVIRNAECDFTDIPEKCKKDGNIIQGNITFGEEYSPAMIKTENKDIKELLNKQLFPNLFFKIDIFI